jgi:hypothetical protein
MRFLVFSLALGFCGCLLNVAQTDPRATETPIRYTVIDKLPAALAKAFQRDGWTAEITRTKTNGLAAQNPNEIWSESHLEFTIMTKRNEAEEELFPLELYGPALKKIKSRMSDAISEQGGELIDTVYSEVYRERQMDVVYKFGAVAGRITLRILPRTNRDDETRTKVEIVIHEQPVE